MPTGRKLSFNGGQLLDAATINATTEATVYTDLFVVSRSVEWAVHLIFAGTPTSTVTLQATCIPNPDETTDTDWVDDGDVTFAGATAGAAKELVEIGNSGASVYRLKIATSVSSGTVSCYISQKPRS